MAAGSCRMVKFQAVPQGTQYYVPGQRLFSRFEVGVLVTSPLTGGKFSACDKEQAMDFQALSALVVARRAVGEKRV